MLTPAVTARMAVAVAVPTALSVPSGKARADPPGAPRRARDRVWAAPAATPPPGRPGQPRRRHGSALRAASGGAQHCWWTQLQRRTGRPTTGQPAVAPCPHRRRPCGAATTPPTTITTAAAAALIVVPLPGSVSTTSAVRATRPGASISIWPAPWARWASAPSAGTKSRASRAGSRARPARGPRRFRPLTLSASPPGMSRARVR
jgi:hypothetical protein